MSRPALLRVLFVYYPTLYAWRASMHLLGWASRLEQYLQRIVERHTEEFDR
jgi:hypothetical protein